MNGRTAFLGLALLASALAAVIAVELDTVGQPVVDATGIVPIRHLPKAQPRVASEDPEDHTDAWVATALARPLFSRNRKPTPADLKVAGGPTLAALPRLTGVVVGPFGRTAIFAGADGGKPVTVTEGNAIGAFTIQTIEPGGVTVSGPQGVQQVSLAADANTRRDLAADIPQPPPPGQPPRIPGLPQGTLPGTVGALRPNFLTQRNGVQFRQAIPGLQPPKPNAEGSD